MPRSFATILMLSALLLVGAGCMPASNTPETSTPAEGSAATDDLMLLESAEREITTKAAPDDTWKTYTNAALGFQFQWPTRGLYAPQWEVTFAGANDASITDGCATADTATERISVNGAEFCHGHSGDDAARTDHFVTKNGDTHVVITFTKTRIANAPDYSWDEYTQELDAIMSTFHYAD